MEARRSFRIKAMVARAEKSRNTLTGRGLSRSHRIEMHNPAFCTSATRLLLSPDLEEEISRLIFERKAFAERCGATFLATSNRRSQYEAVPQGSATCGTAGRAMSGKARLGRASRGKALRGRRGKAVGNGANQQRQAWRVRATHGGIRQRCAGQGKAGRDRHRVARHGLARPGNERQARQDWARHGDGSERQARRVWVWRVTAGRVVAGVGKAGTETAGNRASHLTSKSFTWDSKRRSEEWQQQRKRNQDAKR